MNINKIIISMVAVTILVIGQLSFAQAPDTAWTRLYIGDYLGYFHGQSIRATLDSGLVIAGDLMGQAIILKLDTNGDSLWSDFPMISMGSGFYCVAELANGAIATGGWYRGLTGGRQAYVLVYRNDGQPINGVTLWGDQVDNYGASWIEPTPDSGMVIADYPHERFRITKTDGNYEKVWQRDYGDVGHPGVGCVKATIDGGYIYAGSSNHDGFLIKLNSNGDTLWTRTYGGLGNDYFDEIVQAEDGGYMMLGATNSWGAGGYDIYLVRINTTGDTIWTRTMGTSGDDACGSIDRTPNNGYIISANMYDSTWTSINNILRLDDSGGILWTKIIDPDATTNGNSIVTLPDNGYALTGWFDKGDSQTKGLWVARLAPDPVGIKDSEIQAPSATALIHNYPNPFNNETTIEISLPEAEGKVAIEIYDICGRQVSETELGPLSAGSHHIIWDGSDSDGRAQSSGVYLCKLRAGESIQTSKMVLVR